MASHDQITQQGMSQKLSNIRILNKIQLFKVLL